MPPGGRPDVWKQFCPDLLFCQQWRHHGEIGQHFSVDYPYLLVKPDPYDVANPANKRASWTVTYAKTPVDSSLQTKIRDAVKSSLEKKGYSTTNSDIQVKSLKNLIVNHNDSGRLDNGQLTVILDVKKKSGGAVKP